MIEAIRDTSERTVSATRRLRGEVAVPGDKSITHRALMFNAMASGTARVDDFLDSDDTRSTIACLRALGARIEEVPGGVVVHGQGRAGLHEPDDVLDCGNAGTAMRLLAGVVASLPFYTVLTGDASLRSRPMGRIVQPLGELGVRIAGRKNNTLAPLAVQGGSIKGNRTVRTPVASAQVKSALLIASLAADGPVTVVEPAKSRDHTERMLSAMGVGIVEDGPSVTLTPLAGDLRAVDVRVPGDISTAAAWLVAGAVHPDAEIRLRGVGVNPTRTGIIDILRAMGASIEFQEERVVGGEPVADLVVRSSQLHGVEVFGDLVPRAIDELPLVALCGALASGETVIREASELRVKESDRVATTAMLLRAFGAEVEERPDGMVVQGGAKFHAATAASHGDHRLAMLGAVAALMTGGGDSRILGAGDVAVSYPGFWDDLARLSGA